MLSHVELTVPAELLSDDGRAGLDRLLCGAFGWSVRVDTSTNPVDGSTHHAATYRLSSGQALVLRAGTEGDVVRAGAEDHIGVAVDSDELDRIFGACAALANEDDRVEFKYVVDGRPSAVETPELIFRTFFVRYLLPLWIQVEARVRLTTPK